MGSYPGLGGLPFRRPLCGVTRLGGGRPFPPPQSLATLFGQPPLAPDFKSLADLLSVPVRRQIFISYHHHRDQAYYDALAAMCEDCDFLQDNSLDRRIDSDDAEYQERRIREKYLKGTSTTIVLCGLETYQRKFVDWEIFATLYKESGLIGVQLPNATANPANAGFLVPARLHDNIESGYALWKQWGDITAASLRMWTEEAVAKNTSLIRNWRGKKAQNG